MNDIKTLGIDIAKNVFHLHGVNAVGAKLLQKKVSRAKFLETVINLSCETIVMEACGGANHWARQLQDPRVREDDTMEYQLLFLG